MRWLLVLIGCCLLPLSTQAAEKVMSSPYNNITEVTPERISLDSKAGTLTIHYSEGTGVCAEESEALVLTKQQNGAYLGLLAQLALDAIAEQKQLVAHASGPGSATSCSRIIRLSIKDESL